MHIYQSGENGILIRNCVEDSEGEVVVTSRSHYLYFVLCDLTFKAVELLETLADSAPAPFPPPPIILCFLEFLTSCRLRAFDCPWVTGLYTLSALFIRCIVFRVYQLTCCQNGWPSIQDDGEDLRHEGDAHFDVGSGCCWENQ